MKIELIARRAAERPSRPENGWLHEVFRVTTDDGVIGLCLFHNEWDKRDVMAEELYCEPQVADALRAAMPDMGENGDSPSCYKWFGTDTTEVGDAQLVKDAQDSCETELFCI